jgi:hypothetical protein
MTPKNIVSVTMATHLCSIPPTGSPQSPFWSSNSFLPLRLPLHFIFPELSLFTPFYEK